MMPRYAKTLRGHIRSKGSPMGWPKASSSKAVVPCFLVAAVFLLLVERSVLVVAPMHHLVQDRAVYRFDEQVHVVCPVVERFFEQVEERCVDADLIDAPGHAVIHT